MGAKRTCRDLAESGSSASKVASGESRHSALGPMRTLWTLAIAAGIVVGSKKQPTLMSTRTSASLSWHRGSESKLRANAGFSSSYKPLVTGI